MLIDVQVGRSCRPISKRLDTELLLYMDAYLYFLYVWIYSYFISCIVDICALFGTKETADKINHVTGFSDL